MKDLIKYGLPWIILFIMPVMIANLINFRLGGLGVSILTCISAVYYFNLDNTHSSYKVAIILVLFGWLLSIHISSEFNLGTWIPALLAGTLSYLYFLRFRARTNKLWIDYLKLVGIILLIPTTYFLSGIVAFICMYLASIYFLDRLIIRRQMKKSTQIITFSIMAIMCFSFLIYAFIKADEADKARITADEMMLEAEKLRDESVALQNLAQESAAETKRYQASNFELKEALEICQTK